MPCCGAGNPKGVVLTHTNVLATVKALQVHVKLAGFAIHSDDCVLSYLTLAHIFGRCVEEFVLSLGAQIGYWQARGPVTHLPCYLERPHPPVQLLDSEDRCCHPNQATGCMSLYAAKSTRRQAKAWDGGNGALLSS